MNWCGGLPLHVLLAAQEERNIAQTVKTTDCAKPLPKTGPTDALMAATPTAPDSQSVSRPTVPGLDAAAGRSAAPPMAFVAPQIGVARTNPDTAGTTHPEST